MNCQHCQENLIAYINDEVPKRLHRKIGGHIRSCESCYAAYINERDAAHYATRDLTLLGRAEDTQLNRMWDAIHSELDELPDDKAGNQHGVSSFQRGLVLIALIIIVALPWSPNLENWVSAAVTLRATPAVMPQGTPNSTSTSIASIAVTNSERPTEDVLPPTPTSTPAVAPIPGK